MAVTMKNAVLWGLGRTDVRQTVSKRLKLSSLADFSAMKIEAISSESGTGSTQPREYN
jgi:hypothetical protein